MFQPQLQEKKIFGFDIFIDNDILGEMGDSGAWMAEKTANMSVDFIHFNPSLTIPDLNGRNIQVQYNLN